ncbi:MAG: hypothetical protein ACR2QC_01450 [Gammaproteobacteria bacterium]
MKDKFGKRNPLRPLDTLRVEKRATDSEDSSVLRMAEDITGGGKDPVSGKPYGVMPCCTQDLAAAKKLAHGRSSGKGARSHLTCEEAKEIAREDSSLIWTKNERKDRRQMKSIQRIPAKELKPGMFVDASEWFPDSIMAESEYLEVYQVDRETDQCICVYFVGHNAYRARVDQMIALRAPSYE